MPEPKRYFQELDELRNTDSSSVGEELVYLADSGWYCWSWVAAADNGGTVLNKGAATTCGWRFVNDLHGIGVVGPARGSGADDSVQLAAQIAAGIAAGISNFRARPGNYTIAAQLNVPSNFVLDFNPTDTITSTITGVPAEPLPAPFVGWVTYSAQGARSITDAGGLVEGARTCTVASLGTPVEITVGCDVDIRNSGGTGGVESHIVTAISGAGPYVLTLEPAIGWTMATPVLTVITARPRNIRINGNGATVKGTGSRIFTFAAGDNVVIENFRFEDIVPTASIVGWDFGCHNCWGINLHARTTDASVVQAYGCERNRSSGFINCTIDGPVQQGFWAVGVDLKFIDCRASGAEISMVQGGTLNLYVENFVSENPAHQHWQVYSDAIPGAPTCYNTVLVGTRFLGYGVIPTGSYAIELARGIVKGFTVIGGTWDVPSPDGSTDKSLFGSRDNVDLVLDGLYLRRSGVSTWGLLFWSDSFSVRNLHSVGVNAPIYAYETTTGIVDGCVLDLTGAQKRGATTTSWAVEMGSGAKVRVSRTDIVLADSYSSYGFYGDGGSCEATADGVTVTGQVAHPGIGASSCCVRLRGRGMTTTTVNGEYYPAAATYPSKGAATLTETTPVVVPYPSALSTDSVTVTQVSDNGGTPAAGVKGRVAAVATGTVDLSGLTYPDDFGVKTLTIICHGSSTLVTFSNPANAAAVVTAINTALGTLGTAKLDASSHLVIVDGYSTSASTVVVTSGTLLAATIGFTSAASWPLNSIVLVGATGDTSIVKYALAS